MERLDELINCCQSKIEIKESKYFLSSLEHIYFLKKGKVSIFLESNDMEKINENFECFTIDKEILLLPLPIATTENQHIRLDLFDEFEFYQIHIGDFIRMAKEHFAINIAAKSINRWLSLIGNISNVLQPPNVTKYIILNDSVTEEYLKYCKQFTDHFIKLLQEFYQEETDKINKIIRQDDDLIKQSLASIYQPLIGAEYLSGRVSLEDSYNSCWQQLKKYLNVEKIELSSHEYDSSNFEKNIEFLSRSAKTFYKKCKLTDKWWDKDCGVMVGHLKSKNIPILLMPIRKAGYQFWDPEKNQYVKITNRNVNDIDTIGYYIYPSMIDKSVSLTSILRYGFFTNWFDITFIVLMGAFSGLVALAVPIATGLIFDSVVPWLMQSELVQIGLLLTFLTIVNAIFDLAQYYLIVRVETKLDINFGLMIWGRVLQLPFDFFKKYTVGDLQFRIDGFHTIQDILTKTVVTSLLAVIFSVFSVALLIYYSGILCLVAVLMVFLLTLFDFIFSLISLNYQRQNVALCGKLNGVLQQILQSVPKLRASHAEPRVFNYFSRLYGNITSLSYKIGILNSINGTSGVFISIFAVLIIYATMGGYLSQQLSMGYFLAFMAAFVTLLNSCIKLTGEFVSLMTIIPYYKRFKPILTTETETTFGKAIIGTLTGKVTIDKLCFSYSTNPQKQILNNISMEISSGQSVAIVGASGCGKSTLLKLLIGFYKQYQGSIYYNDEDLRLIDLYQLRQQFGTVMQNDKLMPGDIYSNIVGLSNLPLKNAWEAARKVGLEEDIKNMPMNMFTVIGDSESGLSSGQKQKILLARAIIKNPQILYLDEATSALDNISQLHVMKTVMALPMTKIIIAQRLSTIKNVDYVYVLDEGRVVESGKYDVLINARGAFSKLALRQVV